MAIEKINGAVNAKTIKEFFAQQARAGLPFDPVGEVGLFGGNLTRLQQGMRAFGWRDPRFVTRSAAEANGWLVIDEAISVQVQMRDRENGHAENVVLFNAENVAGMPALAEMLAMPDEEIVQMRERGTMGIEVMPARELQREGAGHEQGQVPAAMAAGGLVGGVGRDVGGGDLALSGRFAVSAPYWLNGLHNSQGIELVKEINAVIKDKGLAEQEAAIEQLLLVYPDARRFGLKVVAEELFLEDPHWKRNLAEPAKLLDGRLVRDKEGAYRPAEGGPAVLVDKGDSLSLKSRDKDGYAAAMELAIAKGWTAIELKGKPAMLADAWLEAKLRGLDVVNYSPTKEDIAKYQERLAKDAAARSVMQEKVVEQSPEQVVVKPFVDAAGQTKMATVVYTVTWDRLIKQADGVAGEEKFSDPQKAAAKFNELPINVMPAVLRSVTRADGYVESETPVAGVSNWPDGNWRKFTHQEIDHEFVEAFEALKTKEVGPVVTEGSFSGMIVDIQDGYAIQKVGRDPAQLVRHPLSRFDSVPEKGKVADIAYDKGGRGVVKSKAKELEREDGGVELAR